jgi:hypothetical protein
MSKELLIEYATFVPTKRLNEGLKSSGGNMIVSGLVQACDKPNANKRIYPYETLHTQVDKYVQGPIAENRALGELDHPEASVVNLSNTSHVITEVWWNGNDLMGKLQLLPTPSGNIAKALILSNIPLGISSRGMGSVKQLGETVEVQDDFELLCWDLVSVPSTPQAYMKLAEGKQYIAKDYSKVNQLITEIICNSTGVCPLC